MMNSYLSEKNWIEKSKTLIYAEWSKFDVHELQIFETYLSRINPRDPESSCVRFTKREYTEMMGYASHKSLKTRTLDKWVRNFIQKQISIAYDGGTKHFNLFSDADVHLDPETGEVVIDLDCNTKLKPVFFNIAEAGYISYRRQNTINLRSEYSVKLYCILKDNAYKGEWTIDLKKLREMLGATEPLYEKFAEFNRRILKKCTDEINATTDTYVEWEKITKGRLTKAICFKIKKNDQQDNDIMDGQMDIDDFIPDQEEVANPRTQLLIFLSQACDDEFNLDQIAELLDLAKDNVEFSMLTEVYHRNLFDYLQRKYRALQNKSGIKSRFGYMKFLVSANK